MTLATLGGAVVAVASVLGPVSRAGVERFFAATLSAATRVPSRLETIVWWLPALSFVTLGLAIVVEVGQALPPESRWGALANRAVRPTALLAGVVIVLNVIRAMDIVGVI